MYAYVSRIENLPTYLAMVTEAHDIGEDRIHMLEGTGGVVHPDEADA